MRFKDKQAFKDGDFYTVEKLSPRMEETPEGFLLCRDVTISRAGDFQYMPYEVGMTGDEPITVTRTPEELFNADTVKSFEGKPVVITHREFVDPKNWQRVTVGIVQNVRRGEGENENRLLADLLLTAQKGIDLVRSGEMREVSCGYDANYIADSLSHGQQVGIVGNHVALVSKARCGSACRIMDSEMTKKSIKTILRKLFKDGDEDAFNEKLDALNISESDEEPNKAPEKTLDDRVNDLEKQHGALLEKLTAIQAKLDEITAPKDTGDEDAEADKHNQADEPKKETADADEDATEEVKPEEAKAVLDSAEELCAGMKKPTADGANGAYTVATIERIKRTAIKGSGVKAFGECAALSGQALDMAFKGALEIVRAQRNPKVKTKDGTANHARLSNAELNKKFNEFWSGR